VALPVHWLPSGNLPLIRSEIEFLGAVGRARKSLITMSAFGGAANETFSNSKLEYCHFWF
jgi:hypothetical protein